MPTPTVTNISPSSGPTAGGTSATITGTNFTGVTDVTIGVAPVSSFTIDGDTQITCTTPAGSAGAANVVVTNGEGASGDTTLYTYLAAPTVTGVSPASGPLGGGGTVTITGTDFTEDTVVKFGGTSATGVTVVSGSGGTSITCTAPARAAGVANVVVTTPGGVSTGSVPYTYLAAPTVTSISPTNGTANGGTSVTITGTNFTGATGVTIRGAAATGVTVVSGSGGTSITCTAPPMSTGIAGTASVLVTTPGGTNAANTLYSYVLTPPTVTAIEPSSGTSDGSTTVMLTGTNFTAATGVKFRGVAATDVNVISATSISCITPAGSLGAASVQVTTPSGVNVANTLFTYVPPVPTVESTSVNDESPGSGSTLGGTTLKVTGTHLTGAGSVTIGGVPAVNVIVLDDENLTCVTPAGSLGARSVVVTTPGGTSAENGLFTYAMTPPTLANMAPITPNSGTDEGGTAVTISGRSFTGATGVKIDGVAATHVIVVNDSTLTCTTPPGTAGTPKSVVVTTPNGSNAANSYFTYVQALPTVASVSPPIGASAGGTSVTITGTHLTGASSVKFGGLPATGITVVNQSTITCTTPAGLAGTASVLVTAAAGTSAANSLYYYVQAVPTDTYIYLKGGRGDGFVPLWTGALNEEGMVSETGATLGTAGKEVSDPYRDIFPSSSLTQDYKSYVFYLTPYPYTAGGTGNNFYPEEGSSAANSGKGRLSDEVSHVKPRQYARVATWLIFTSQSGISYKFRKDQILGWGSQPRA